MSIAERIDETVATIDQRVRTGDLPTPVYAAVGLAERISAQVADLPAIAADLQGAAASRVRELRADATNRAETVQADTAMRYQQLREQVQEEITLAWSRVTGDAQALPHTAKSRAAAIRERAGDEFDALATHGEAVLKQRHAEDAIGKRMSAAAERVTPALARASVATRDAAERARKSRTAARLAETTSRARAAVAEAEAAAEAQHRS